MKSFRLLILLFIAIAIPLNAQTTVEQNADADSETVNPAEENQGINASGGIVVRERAVRNIEQAATSTEITAKDVEGRSDKLLKDVLTQVPGMQVVTQRKGTTKFSMRGYDMSKVAILIDGIPVIDSFGGGMDIDNIGLMDISEIIVSRGTCSALYGARGAVGSINFIKKEPVEMYTSVSAEYATPMNFVGSVSHGAPIGNFYYYISGIYDRSNGYNISGKLDRAAREKWLLKLSRYDLYGFKLSDIYNNSASCAATSYLNDTGLWDHTEHEKYKVNGKAGYHITPDLEIGTSAFYNHTEKKNSIYFTDMTSMYTYNDYTKQKDWRLPDSSYILRNISSLWPEYNDYAISPYIIWKKDNFSVKGNFYYYNQSNTFLAYADPAEKVLAYNRDKQKMTWSIWTSMSYGFNIYPTYKPASWNTMNFALSYYISDHIEEEQAYNNESTEIITNYGKDKYKMLYIEAGYLTLAFEDEMHIMDNIEVTMGVSYDAQDLMKYTKKQDVKGSTKMIDQYQAMDDSMIWGTRDSFNPVAGIVYEPVRDFLKLRASGSMKTSFPTLAAYTKTLSPYQESSDLGSADVKIKPEKTVNANSGFELSFFDKRLVFSSDYFFSRYYDKITKIYITKSDDYIYRNLDSALVHGVETILKSNIHDVFDTADLELTLTHTFLFTRNLVDADDSFVNKGDKIEKTPEHKFTFDFRTHFRTDTSLIIFGYYEYNQIQYTMRSRPATTDEFSTSYFRAEKLHNPLMLDVKVSQKFLSHYEVYVMCKNVLDDYAADPFNPGPGRQYCVGAKASF